ncbi:hypothetical protein SAMN02910263_04282 [Butyrivibrio sp. INlla16]|nr:hypothetical protein SAMN02910263_04282 [Butyrivibrio sp. INlla16]
MLFHLLGIIIELYRCLNLCRLANFYGNTLLGKMYGFDISKPELFMTT